MSYPLALLLILGTWAVAVALLVVLGELVLDHFWLLPACLSIGTSGAIVAVLLS